MRKILLDTNAYAAFKRGDTEAVEVLRHAETIALSVIVLGELLSGFKAGSREERNRRELDAFLHSPRVSIVAIDDATAEFYAHVFIGLKRRSKPIPTNDLWIGASALQHGFAVFTFDQHFRDIEGLITGSKLADFLP